MDITYRIATPEDTGALAALVNAQYMRPHPPTYFQWQFFCSHYPAVCMTAWDGRRLIGMAGIQQRPLTNGLSAGHLIDLLVDPEYRGRGIFTRCCEKALKHFDRLDLLTVLPNANGKSACVHGMGMTCIAKIDDLVLRDKGANATGTTDPIIESYVRFATDQRVRSWRYEKSPLYRYRTIGPAIVKAFMDPLTKETFTDIVDWEHHPTPQEAQQVCSSLRGRRQDPISTWALPHTPRYRMLKQLGFAPLPRERYFCVRTLTNTQENLENIATWQLVPGDAEIY